MTRRGKQNHKCHDCGIASLEMERSRYLGRSVTVTVTRRTDFAGGNFTERPNTVRLISTRLVTPKESDRYERSIL